MTRFCFNWGHLFPWALGATLGRGIVIAMSGAFVAAMEALMAGRPGSCLVLLTALVTGDFLTAED
jgi:hypothetical protein